MGTRGCVAFGNEKKWEGFYNSHDSYPTYLGKYAWKRYKCGHLISEIIYDPSPEPTIITSENPDPLYIEWVYIITPQNTFLILANIGINKFGKPQPHLEPRRRKDGWWDYGHCLFKHFKVGEYPLNGEEPNWEDIQENYQTYIIQNLLEKVSRKSEAYAIMLKVDDKEKIIYLLDHLTFGGFSNENNNFSKNRKCKNIIRASNNSVCRN